MRTLLLFLTLAIFYYGCYSTSSKVTKKQSWENDCDKILYAPSYDEFIRKANHPLRTDSIIALRINEIQSMLKPFLLENDSIFQNTTKCVLNIEILPNGKTDFKSYNDTIAVDTTISKKINNKLSSLLFDSIPYYDACKVIRFTVKLENNKVTFDKIFTTQFIGLGRRKASIMCVVMKNLAQLRYAYNLRLRERPGINGRITVKFAIDEHGKIIFCKVVSTTMNDPPLENAVVDKITKWEFPVIYRSRDVTEVVYPFVFSQ